jgi:hypothetical protein
MGKTIIKGIIVLIIIAIIGGIISYLVISPMEYEIKKIIGTWEDEEGKIYTFSADGKFSGAPWGVEMTRDFELRDDQLLIKHGDMDDIFNYTFSQDNTILTITAIDTEESIILTKISEDN